MEGVWLTQTHTGFQKLLDGRTEGAEIALQDPGAALVLGLKLRRHGVGLWRERAGRRREKRREEVSEWTSLEERFRWVKMSRREEQKRASRRSLQEGDKEEKGDEG